MINATNMKDKKTSIEYLPIENLFLDKDNPRFAGMLRETSQKGITQMLWGEMHLDELIFSISANGYYVQEPLLVVKESDKFVVVEGNRRLAAVKILLDSNLAKYVGARLSDLPKISSERAKKLRNLPVIIYSNRNELWSYLSYRHVNGPRNWSPISKAEYVAHLHNNLRLPFETIIGSIGDKNKTVIKLFNGLMVLRQGEIITRFKRDDFQAASFNFSHLYTIIQYPSTQKFIGIDGLKSGEPFPENPVPEEKKTELEELLIWIFGSKATKSLSLIRSQNPDLRNLDDVISNNDALIYLRNTGSLFEAFEYTKKEDRRFEEYLTKSEMNIRKAKGMEDAYKGDDKLLQKIDSIFQISRDMQKSMSKIARKLK